MHLVLVDGSGFIFRAFHALPQLNRKSDGLPVGCVAGFCSMIFKLTEDLKGVDAPTHMAVIFDYSSKTFRDEIYSEYKSHRPPTPEELIPQFPLTRAATRAYGLPSIEMEGWEADDIIATYATLARAEGWQVTIVSSDKDLMQLVRPGVEMMDPIKKTRIGPAEVMEKFGVTPDKVVDVQALAGDSTDNVPGVPGIGVKTAAQLIIEYGDLEQLLFRAGEIKQPKRREALLENAEKARISRKLVLLDDKVDLDVPLDDLAVHEPDARKLIAFLKAMEFSTLTRRVAEYSQIDPADVSADIGAKSAAPATSGTKAAADGAIGDLFPGDRPLPAAAKSGDKQDKSSSLKGTPVSLADARAEAIKKIPVDRKKYETIRSLDALKAWTARAADIGHFVIDAMSESIDPMQADISGLALALGPNDAAYVPLGHKQSGGGAGLFDAGLAPDQIKAADALSALKPLLESAGIMKVGYNIKFTAVVLAQHGIMLRNHDDVQLMSYALDAGRNSHAMASLASRWFDHVVVDYGALVGSGKGKLTFDQVATDKAAEYAAEYADMIERLWRVLKPRLVAERMNTVYETLERPLVSVLARMERRGISIDRQVLSRLSGEFAQTAARVEADIQELAGEPINVGSPKQLGDIIFGKMGLPGGTKTKTGAWSTSAQVLDELAEQGHEFPKKILEWRQVSKLKSTYTDALPAYVHPQTHRVHTTYALAATTTGRLSSNEPNLQNIPVRTEDGRKIRKAFIATKGNKLVSADYSQIELRLLAEIADIPSLKQAFHDKLDIHAMTASEMFGVPIKDMPGEVRRRAKAINFGIIYGISAFGLANQLGIPREEAGAYIKKYFERFPGIRAYMDATREYCREHGYVETIFGRKCHYPDIKASNPSIRSFNERAAINARLQGSAADIIRRAMIRMEDALAEHRLSAQMLLQVHDELIFEVPENEVAKTLPVIQHVMQDAPFPAVSLSVPLQVDARAASNWDEAH